MARKIVTMFLAFVLLCGCGSVWAEPQDTVGNVIIETAETDDFSMGYCKFGSGEKTFVILPGLSIQSVLMSADAIAQAYQPLAEEFTIYVFDIRQNLPESYSVFDMARDTAAVFQELGLEHINVFGASYGGMAAMVIAMEHPELIDKTVLVSTTAALTDEEYQILENWIRLAEEGDAEKLYLDFGKLVYSEEVFEQSQELLIEAAKTVTEEDLKRFITLVKGIKGFDVTADLENIQCPLLAIGDMKDSIFGTAIIDTIGRYLDQKPDFELYMYDGYGHAVYDTAPDFKERVLHFLLQDPADHES